MKGKGNPERRKNLRPSSQTQRTSPSDTSIPTVYPKVGINLGAAELPNVNTLDAADGDTAAFQTPQNYGADLLEDPSLLFQMSEGVRIGGAYSAWSSATHQLPPSWSSNTNFDLIDSHILWQPEGYFDFDEPIARVDDSVANLQLDNQAFSFNEDIDMFSQILEYNDWLKKRHIRDHHAPRHQPSFAPDFDFGGIWHNIVDETNKKMIATNLMRIYHDSLENALSSWLSERTCPYGIGTGNSEIRVIDEWGPNWSNRICTRVCQLDTAFNKLRRRPFTARENSKASRVLNTTIMAFSSQWSQTTPPCLSGEQKNSLHSTLGQNPIVAASGSDFPSASGKGSSRAEFDHSLQRDLWYTAHKSLQDAADMDSFKVIFAHMVFGLIQKPLESEERVRTIGRKQQSQFDQSFCENSLQMTEPTYTQQLAKSNDAILATSSVSAVLDTLIDLQGPPVYLEVALRHLFSWRTRLEKHHHSELPSQTPANYPRNSVPSPDSLHKRSFNLLFWLGVMCDTTSAAINQRPLVISDEDSNILNLDPDLQPQENVAHPMRNPPHLYLDNSSLWGGYLLKKKRIARIPRWPCAPEEAAATLCEATPMKVLLYRKVARLQTLCYRHAPASELEQCIDSALAVYQEWNSLYRQFMLDCVGYHDELPPRIQSWYVILSCHWFLACLLLADNIEAIDLSNRGLEARKFHRELSDLIANLRKQNAAAIASVASVSSRCKNGYGKAGQFHSVIGDAALLSEPWTDILMRSFTKAAESCLQTIRTHETSRTSCYMGRAWEDGKNLTWGLRKDTMACIQGLKVLGRKSEMADILATALLEDLEHCLTSSSSSWLSQSLNGQESRDSYQEPQPAFIRDICDLVTLEHESEGDLLWEK